jgi:hypothetical protein
MVKFDRCPHLDNLIEELTKACAICYEMLPSARDIQALEDALEAHVDTSTMPLRSGDQQQKHCIC